jgi:hypothetical protein
MKHVLVSLTCSPTFYILISKIGMMEAQVWS